MYEVSRSSIWLTPVPVVEVLFKLHSDVTHAFVSAMNCFLYLLPVGNIACYVACFLCRYSRVVWPVVLINRSASLMLLLVHCTIDMLGSMHLV